MSPGAERTARHRARNPERVKAQWRKWSASPEGTVTCLLNYARDRARRQGVAFDLSRDFVRRKLALGKCELSGLAIERVAPGQYRTHPYAPSLDRKDPSQGYIETNVRLLCFAVNRARSDWGDEVLLTIASGLVKQGR